MTSFDLELTRRSWLRASLATGYALGVGGSTGCRTSRWESTSQDVWQPVDDTAARSDAMLELVRLATLAANSHNSQPWHFAVEADAIRIHPDFERRLPVVDPDDHHLFASLGCAAENIVQAAPALGFAADVRFVDVEPDPHVRVTIARGAVERGSMVEAIHQRACTRSTYDGQSIGAAELDRLASAASPHVHIDLITDRFDLDAAAGLIERGNTVQVEDQRFRDELKAWLRFNEREAVELRDGIFSASTGSPTAPRWLAERFFDRAFTAKGENEKIREQMASTPCVAVLTAETQTKASWVEVGRACQRLSLLATDMGIAHAHLNQPVEVASLRPELARLIGRPGSRPDLLMRLGYGPPLARSLRRPLADVV